MMTKRTKGGKAQVCGSGVFFYFTSGDPDIGLMGINGY